jgi:hypothetical protein
MGSSWTLYNQTSGSSSVIHFNAVPSPGPNTYSRLLNGNNLTGTWGTSVVTEQQLRLCPDQSKWISSCVLFGLRIDNANTASMADHHGDILRLTR